MIDGVTFQTRNCVFLLAQARNALLAAYFILDDDGARGLSRDQLVGVLTTEAGVGIDTEQVGVRVGVRPPKAISQCGLK